MTTNPKVLRMAREIAAGIAPFGISKEPVVEALCETFYSLERYDHLRQSEKDNSGADRG